MSDNLTGGCLCGAVRYTLTQEPQNPMLCHCGHCQKQSGTMASTIVGVPEAGIELTGELKTYHDTADSGSAIERKFCPQCGSPVISLTRGTAGMVWLKVGTFDDTSWYKPVMNIWTDSAQSWFAINADAMNFAKNPGG